MKPCPICENTGARFERLLNKTRLLKCSSCGFVFADLEDSFAQEKNASFSQRNLTMCEEQQGGLDEAWFGRIAEHFTRNLRPGRVLDVGCGNGRLLNYFHRFGWECFGSDPSPWSRSAAEKYGFSYLPERVEALSPEEFCFDLVVSTSTLEHISHPLPHVRSILALLRPGGVAYFAGVPNYGSLSARLGFSSFHFNTPPLHVNYFTPRSMRELFERAGLPGQRVAIRTYGIPELHAIRDRLKRRIKLRRVEGNSEVAAVRNEENEVQASRFLRLLVAANYYAGKPFGLGDKLEVVVMADVD